MQITNADRRLLLENFRVLSVDWSGNDRDLILWTSQWITSLAPTFGFERTLARDAFFLCETLRKAGDAEAAKLARGGLAYLHTNNKVNPLALGSLGLLDDAFVAGYAAHVVREMSGDAPNYCLPQLAANEKARAEAIFLDLLGRSADQDNVLPELAMLAIAKLGYLVESGFFRRLRTNVAVLTHVLQDLSRPQEQRQIARAALHYLTHEQDAIPDSLGLVGYLDDYFIVNLAIELISPAQPPWMNLIDAVVGAWPFLNMVTFGDSDRGFPASEFMMVNAALACPVLRGSASGEVTYLVLPRIGPISLLLALFASLGEIHAARRQQGPSISFDVGQKVLVDGNAVRTFLGCRCVNGRTEFGLRKTYKDRGQTLNTDVYWPIDQLFRIAPAGSKRAVRGKLSFSAQAEAPLDTLDFIFLATESVAIPQDLAQVVLVTAAGNAKRLAESITLFGQPLCEIIPMGSLSMAGEQVLWSDRFGKRRPSVLIVPDLDRACEYIEGAQNSVILTIVEASGHNAGRMASLSRLKSLGISMLVTVSEADADEVLDDEPHALIWDWSPDDFASMAIERQRLTTAKHEIQVFEQAIFRAASTNVEVARIDMPEADNAFDSLSALKRMVESRGEDVPKELGDILGQAFSLMIRLLRCPFTVSRHPLLQSDFASRLETLARCNRNGLFLSSTELDVASIVEQDLRKLFSRLTHDNPKEHFISNLRHACPAVMLVCQNVELLNEVERDRSCDIHSALNCSPETLESGWVIAGWFNHGTMTNLLRPPFATPLHLLLFGPEHAWYRGFSRRIKGVLATRRSRAGRNRVFPNVGAWPDPTDDSPAEHVEPVVESEDHIQLYLQAERRRQLTSLVRAETNEEAVKAKLVTFDEGYAFLTPDYRAKVATHLLNETTQAKTAELEIIAANRLKRGDLLMFLRGSDRDVIRQVADRFLFPGERERAAMWRHALIRYQQHTNCSIEVIWRRLGEHGCPLSLAAITNWFTDDNIISPLSVDREFAAILSLTQDTDLHQNLDVCRAAISRVKGAHMRASNELARKVLDRAVKGLKAAASGFLQDVDGAIVLARITEIDNTQVLVKASSVNRLVEEGATWHG